MQIKRLASASVTGAIVCATMLAYFLAAPALADEIKAGDLVITQAWSRATPGGAKVAGGYLTIQNKGSAADRLIGGSADIADKSQGPEMATTNGVMTMRPPDKGLFIEARKNVKVVPGGHPLMPTASK